MATDHYQRLGLTSGASTAEIKAAFRRLARQHHPDVSGGDPGAEQRFKDFNEAYQVLSDPAQRAAYDRLQAAGAARPPFSRGESSGEPAPHRRPAEPWPFEPFDADLFEPFFSTNGGPFRAGFEPDGPARRRAHPDDLFGTAATPATGGDLSTKISIDLATAINGAEQEISYPALERCATCGGSGARVGTSPSICRACGGSGTLPTVHTGVFGPHQSLATCGACHGEGRIIAEFCPSCHGEGRRQGQRHLRIKIPAGTADHGRIRLRGVGQAGRRGGPAGDLYLEVTIKTPPGLRRSGNDLRTSVRLSVAAVALGTRVAVPRPEGGSRMLEIPAGTQPGKEIILPGEGLPIRGKTGARGDFRVKVEVRVPTRLSARVRRLFEELAVEEH